MFEIDTITFWAFVGCVASISYGAFTLWRSKTEAIIKRRVTKLQGETASDQVPTSFWDAAFNLWSRFFPEQNKSADLHSRLRLAGFFGNRSYAAYQIIRATLFVAGGIIGFCMIFVFPGNYLLVATSMLIGAGIGFLVPSLAVDVMQKRRYRQLLAELPDFSDLLIVCLNAGMSLEAAIRFVADEFGQNRSELHRELRIVKHDLSLGLSVDEAFTRLSERCKHDSVGMLATFMRESRKMGTPVLESIRRHSEAIRIQIEQEAEEQSQKAAVKMMFPTLLLVMPATFVVLAGPAVLLIQESFCK